MNNPLLNRPQHFTKLSVPSQLILASLLVGLLGTIGTSASVKASMAPLVAQAESEPSTSPVVQQLHGQWEVENPSTGETLQLIFTPEGEFFMLFPKDAESSLALPLKYQIDPAPQPMHIDVMLPDTEKPVKTIFELTAEGQLRLQLFDTSPGEPRPTAFTPEAMLFDKISDETTLPANTEVFNPEAQRK